MKKVFLSVGLIGIVAVVTVLSCKKTKYNAAGPTQTLNQLFAGLRTTPQKLSVSAGRDTIVYGTNGTMLHFYVNSFKTVGGTIITSGTINLQLVEMYSVGDMIANRTSTITPDGKLIQSTGQVNITATMNGATVYANKYGLGFAQNGSSSQKMEMFYGSTNTSDSTANWTVCDTTLPGTVSYGTDSAGDSVFYSNYTYVPPPKPWYYVFDSCSSFGFMNSDYWSCYNGSLTQITAVMPDTSYNRRNTQVYVTLTADKVNLDMYDNDSGGFAEQVPPGLNYTIVAITNKNGSFYFCQQSGVTASGLKVSMAMASDAEGDIISRLLGL